MCRNLNPASLKVRHICLPSPCTHETPLKSEDPRLLAQLRPESSPSPPVWGAVGGWLRLNSFFFFLFESQLLCFAWTAVPILFFFSPSSILFSQFMERLGDTFAYFSIPPLPKLLLVISISQSSANPAASLPPFGTVPLLLWTADHLAT